MRRALALLLAAGCAGSVSDPAGAPGPTGTAPGASPITPAAPPVLPAGSACGAADLPPARTWRLTNNQLRNTVQAVFGFTGPTLDQLPVDGQPDGFTNQADRLSVPPLLASKLVQATDEIADGALARSGQLLGCPVAALGTGSCLRDFLTTVGARAWRRPLTPAEVAKYSALPGRAAPGDPAAGFKAVVQALLLSPSFLFRTELGAGGGPMVALTDHELASALSYMILDGPPDARLMELAGGGRLHDPPTLAAEARRLLASKDAPAVAGAFFRQWLQFDTLPAAAKDPALFPMYTPELVGDLLAGNQALIAATLFDPAGGVKALLTAPVAYVTSRTAPLYGVAAPGAALARAALPAAERRGILTDAAFIAGASDPDETNLPARGRVVREQVLCETVAPPPGNFPLEDPKITPDMTNREKFLVHTTNPGCAACHDQFDGIGYAMEQYDPIGRFRTVDKKKTIDPSGTLPLPGGTLTFGSYVDLVDQLAARPETYRCVASQYAAFATGRAPSAIPGCESESVARAFAAGGYRLEALVTAIVTSPTFSLRRN